MKIIRRILLWKSKISMLADEIPTCTLLWKSKISMLADEIPTCRLLWKSKICVQLGVAFLLHLAVFGTGHAGELKATIVEENGGAIGKINWVVINEQDFSPVLEGEGSSIRANLDPGLYIVSVDGDTQGRKSVKIDQGIKSIKISTRKFY